MLAALAMDHGREPEARMLLDELAAGDFANLSVDEELLASLSLLTEVCWWLADTERAAVLYELLLPFRELNAVAYPEAILGSMERPLAILSGMTGRSAESEDHFRRALDENARMGARPFVAHTQHDHARMLIRRGAEGERHRGLQLLAATGEAYRDLGMKPWAARVEEELEASR